jgi:hypothetical protein
MTDPVRWKMMTGRGPTSFTGVGPLLMMEAAHLIGGPSAPTDSSAKKVIGHEVERSARKSSPDS